MVGQDPIIALQFSFRYDRDHATLKSCCLKGHNNKVIVEVCQQMQNQMDLSASDSSKNVQWRYGTQSFVDDTHFMQFY